MATDNASNARIEEGSERLFHGLVESARTRRSKRRILALQAAIVAHVAVLCVIVLRDYFEVPPIQEPPLAVSFAQLAPPPPPPPAAPKVQPKPKPETPRPQEMTEPVRVPEEISQEPVARSEERRVGKE